MQEQMKHIVDFFFNLVIIIGLLSVAYAMIWSAIFVPINKLRKHKERIDELNKEYNKIEVEHAYQIKAKETTDKELQVTYARLHQSSEQLKEMEKKVFVAKEELKEIEKQKVNLEQLKGATNKTTATKKTADKKDEDKK